ncbi:MAG TPA: hypothetical protein VFZ38_15100 [Vicinamibacterales bacterium]
MATFRSRTGFLGVLWFLGFLGFVRCSPHSAQEVPAPAAAVAPITRATIEHVTPKRDFVGAAPKRLEWTAVEGVDSYGITVVNEVDALLVEYRGLKGTSIDWPKEVRLEAGTYFWRIVGVNDGRSVADSGRAAFVVTGNPDRDR